MMTRTVDRASECERALEVLYELMGNDPELNRLSEHEPTAIDVRTYAATALRRGVDASTAIEFSGVILRLDELRRREVDDRFRLHSDQIDALQRVARTVDDNTDRISQVVTQELCTNLGYGKSMFSVVRGSVWSPVSLAVNPGLTGDFRDLITAIDGREIALRDAPREAELVRRRKPYAVDGVDTYRHTYRPLIDLSRPAGYLATPVVIGSKVVAIIHVDRQTDDLTDSDIHIVETLASMCAVSTERAQLPTRIQSRNDEVLDEMQRLSDELRRLDTVRASIEDQYGGTSRTPSATSDDRMPVHGLPRADTLTAVSVRSWP
ncbi:GAF domain-containing protein [Rhodococcoides fascians]|uniref:GAF domain-containing protein n=1 Tax=Rhodococcoides fascians TaxID=1828 RepID=UPI002E76B346|nr:GAF domain-containing protein [Rhodococcus fascians]